jgi:hypothetical protein
VPYKLASFGLIRRPIRWSFVDPTITPTKIAFADETNVSSSNCHRNSSNRTKAALDRSFEDWQRLGAIMSLNDMHMNVLLRRVQN